MTNTHCITPIVYDFMTQQQQSPARALLSKTCTLLSRSSGRDKICKLLQYGCLYLSQLPLQHRTQKKLLKITSQMRIVRKVFRFVRGVEFLKRILQSIRKLQISHKHSKLWSLSLLFSIVSSVAAVGFYLCDHRVFLAEVGAIDKTELTKYLTDSYFWWWLECVFTILRGVCEYFIVRLRKETTIQDINIQVRREKVIMADCLRNFVDSMIAYSQTTMVDPKERLTRKSIGKLGVVSAVLGIYVHWP